VTFPGREELAQDPDFALEMQAAYLLGPDHLRRILKRDDLLFNFNSFLVSYRPADVLVLQYYLSALRALDLISAANSIISTLPSSYDYGFDASYVPVVSHSILEQKVEQAFAVLQYESLPAYIAYGFHMTNAALHRKVTRALGEGSSVQSDSLAQMFCVTDPEQIDNPIIFASKEFSRSTNYPMKSILNRNPSFLHGPMTDIGASDRIASAIAAQRSHSEVMVSYRSDGSPFLSLQTVTPLRDTRGRLRYWLRGFVDCSDLLRQGANSWSFPCDFLPASTTSASGGPKKPESKLRKVKSFYSVYTEQSVSLENYPIKLDEQTLAHSSPTSTTAVELPATPVAAGFASVGFEDAPAPSHASYPMGLDMRSPGIYHRVSLPSTTPLLS
jgi:PAS domain-containing protein